MYSCSGWYIKFKKIKNSVLYWLVWKYFDFPEATELRRVKLGLRLEIRFQKLIWESIVRDVVNHKGIFESIVLFAYLIK